MSNPEERQVVDDRLDHLYMRNFRCPYCHTSMPKGTARCENCGLTKEQIYFAQVSNASRKSNRNRVLYSPVRPKGLAYWKMLLSGIFGFTGAHCFLAKRYWRGAVILLCTVLFMVSIIVFNIGYTDPYTGEEVATHAWRKLFQDQLYPFPPDMFGWVAAALWIWDLVCIVTNRFKYPVIIAAAELAQVSK